MRLRIGYLFAFFASIALSGGALAQEYCPQFRGKWNQRYGVPDEFYFGKGRGERYVSQCDLIAKDIGDTKYTKYDCDGAIVVPQSLIFTDKSGEERAWVVQQSEASKSCGETADGKYYFQLVETVEWLTVKHVDSSPIFTRVFRDYTYYRKTPKLDM